MNIILIRCFFCLMKLFRNVLDVLSSKVMLMRLTVKMLAYCKIFTVKSRSCRSYKYIQTQGKESTLSRGRSASAPELSSSVTLAPLSKGIGTSEELIVHPSHEV